MNPYLKYVTDFRDLIVSGKSLPLGVPGPGVGQTSVPDAAAPRALIFSPHPDDECITGALPLRLTREAWMRVTNIAVTLGSNRDRQRARWKELSDACRWLGFGLESLAPNGLEQINPKTRSANPKHWESALSLVAGAILRHKPRVIIFPHEQDGNSTHIGTHLLVADALKLLPSDFSCFVVETEFWAANPSANLMIESSPTDVADLVSALTFHVGEIRRNAYHLRLPAWMIDNVRRGAELAGAQGGAAPDFVFATLYRLRRCKNGRLEDFLTGGRQVPASQSIASFFFE